MNRKQKKNLIRIIIAAVLLIFIKLVSLPAWLSVVLYLAAYIVIGYDILRKAFKGILNKHRIYVSAQNILTITGIDDYDPEKYGTDTRGHAYPNAKTFSVGLNITL